MIKGIVIGGMAIVLLAGIGLWLFLQRPEFGHRLRALWKFVFDSQQELVPQHALPSAKTDLKSLDPSEDIVVWPGHSSFYLQLGDDIS